MFSNFNPFIGLSQLKTLHKAFLKVETGCGIGLVAV